MKTDNTYTLVATAKNEGPYLLEWVAHHLLIGFNNIIIFQNDSDDGTDKTLECLQSLGIVNYKYNHAPPGKHQIKAYKRAARQPEYKRSNWVMALDLDEFLCVKVGDGKLADWMSMLPDADAIYVNWRLFGSNGLETMPTSLTTEAFTRAEETGRLWTGFNPYKTMFRRKSFLRPGIHKPQNDPEAPPARIINSSGFSEHEIITQNFQCSDPECLKYAQVNHYIVRDAASFVLKSFKGSAHQSNRPIDRKYWSKRNRNNVPEFTLADRAPELRVKMAELNMMSDGKLFELRDKSIAVHNAKLERALQDPDMRELYDYCLKTPGAGL